MYTYIYIYTHTYVYTHINNDNDNDNDNNNNNNNRFTPAARRTARAQYTTEIYTPPPINVYSV